MGKLLGVIIMVLASFAAEGLWQEFLSPRWAPNLLIILVVFFNLFRGIRYCLFAAVLAGLLKDSYGVSVFGLHLFAFVACGYLTTMIKVTIYQPGSRASRVLILFLVCLINLAILLALREMFAPVDLAEAFTQVVLPEVIVTTVVANTVFENLKRCALKFFA